MNRLNIVNKIKSLPKEFKSAVVYVIATLFSKGLAIITVPIFTRIMTTSDIGIVNLFNSWYSILLAISTLSLASGGYSVALKEYSNKRDEYISSVLTLTSINALIIMVIYIIFHKFWNQFMGLPTNLILLMLFGLLVSPATEFWLARQRFEYKYIKSGILTIVSALVASGLSVIVVLRLGNTSNSHIAEGRLYANYVIVFGVAIVLWIYQIYKGKTFYCKMFWKNSLSMSIPLVGYSVASQILNVSDRMMIDSMVGKSAVGIYSTLYTVSSISLLVWSSLNSSFAPYLFQNIEKKESKIKSTSLLMLSLYAIIAIGLTYFAPEIIKILATKEYYEAIYIMPPIAAGIFLTSVAHTYSNILVYYKKTKYIMYAASVAAGVNVALNYIFIPKLGYYAAAYTTLVSYIILAYLQVYCGNKVSKEKNTFPVYENKRIFCLAIFTIMCTLFSLLVYNNFIVRYICIGVIFIIGIFLTVRFIRNKYK